jgi:Tfp pilus assembly protein PilN
VRPLNLIPPEERRGESAPLRVGALSYAIVGVLAAALIAVVALVLTTNGINESKTQLASLQVRLVAAQEAAAKLAPYNDFASLTQSRNATVTSLAQSRFDWDRVLQELALVIPPDVTLVNLSAAATGASAASTSTTGAAPVSGPSLQLSGCAKGQEGVAELLAALRDIDGVTRVGMQSSQLSDEESGQASAGTAATGGCDTSSKAANFQITVAFDAVTVAAPTGTTGATGVPVAGATTTPAPATTTPAAGTTPTADNSGVAQTQTEQATANASADNQTRKAGNAADALGGGK